MAKHTIMLACSAGMSTSLLVAKMQKIAASKGIDAKIFATSAGDAENKVDSEKPDVLLIGPQVRYLLSDFKKKLDIPVDVIDMRDYGQMNGEHVLNTAMKMIKTNQ